MSSTIYCVGANEGIIVQAAAKQPDDPVWLQEVNKSAPAAALIYELRVLLRPWRGVKKAVGGVRNYYDYLPRS